jgi:hypothetical protein
MAPLELEPFSAEDAEDFVRVARPGVPPFTAEERSAILSFAKGHPLALQVACFHVLEARQARADLGAAIDIAASEMTTYLPAW